MLADELNMKRATINLILNENTNMKNSHAKIAKKSQFLIFYII